MKKRRSLRRTISAGISPHNLWSWIVAAAALVAVGFRAALPSLRVDAVTLGLLGIAAISPLMGSSWVSRRLRRLRVGTVEVEFERELKELTAATKDSEQELVGEISEILRETSAAKDAPSDEAALQELKLGLIMTVARLVMLA